MRRHDVLPGISGWAQVNGLRGDTSIYERVKYDIWYMLRREGINSGSNDTMAAFTGTSAQEES